MVEKHTFGTTPQGEEVRTFTLRHGTWSADVMDFGATLLALRAPDRTGAIADIVLGFDRLDGYFDDPACYGATIGPSANRTDKGEITVDGTVWQLARNDGPANENNLHTDLEHGLHKRVWNAEVADCANAVTFRIHLAHGELGLPGERDLSVRYELVGSDDACELVLTQRCATDRPTFVNTTNHSYFNLAGHDSGDVLDQTIRINATTMLPVREDSVSKGDIVPVAGTPFDFTRARPVGKGVDQSGDVQIARGRGYDHCFCIEGWVPDASPRPALWAADPTSGRSLEILITDPGAHLYTGNWLDDANAKNGASYGPRSGFAFEPEFYPDCTHHAAWPQPVCTPAHPFSSTIVYRLGTQKA